MTALWPDADGASAKASFDTALFRLRKLLDVDNALVLAGGKLSLDAVARVDRRVGARSGARRRRERARRYDDADESRRAAARRVLDAYPGPLLGAEENAWIVKPRDALRARVVRTLMRLGERWSAQRDWATAVDVYRRGLEADNLAESFYRGLMRALAATRRPGRGDQRVPPVPRAPLDRARGQAVGGNRAAAPGNRRRPRAGAPG